MHMNTNLQDYERQEDERSDYLKDHFLKYVDLCVGVNEANAEVCLSLLSPDCIG